jgi:hypothetical protein
MKRVVVGAVELRSIPVSPNANYMAGSDGNIYSRTRYAGFGRKIRVDWYPLSPHLNARGYKTITMCHENKKVTKSIHRLVCMAFHGMPKSETLQVRHLDGDPENNLPTNLAWGTQEENWQDRKAHGHGCEGENHPMSKLSDEERSHIRWAVKKGLCSARLVARVLGMSPSSISNVLRSGARGARRARRA